MANALLLTVWHTGTKYFIDGLSDHYAALNGRASYSHLNYRWRYKADNADILYTTYRNPMRVAASWVNRGHDLKRPGVATTWKMQWENYSELLSMNPIVLDFTKGQTQHGIKFGDKPVNTSEDVLKLHKALDEENLDYFYRKAPKDLIDFAYECLNEL